MEGFNQEEQRSLGFLKYLYEKQGEEGAPIQNKTGGNALVEALDEALKNFTKNPDIAWKNVPIEVREEMTAAADSAARKRLIEESLHWKIGEVFAGNEVQRGSDLFDAVMAEGEEIDKRLRGEKEDQNEPKGLYMCISDNPSSPDFILFEILQKEYQHLGVALKTPKESLSISPEDEELYYTGQKVVWLENVDFKESAKYVGRIVTHPIFRTLSIYSAITPERLMVHEIDFESCEAWISEDRWGRELPDEGKIFLKRYLYTRLADCFRKRGALEFANKATEKLTGVGGQTVSTEELREFIRNFTREQMIGEK